MNKKVTFAGVALLVALFATGCTPIDNSVDGDGTITPINNGVDDPGVDSTDDPEPDPSATPSPTPTPTPGDPDYIGEDVFHEHDSEELREAAIAYTESFAALVTNRDITVEQWRERVVPQLYDVATQDLYSNLDAYNFPFCTPVEQVTIGAGGTFSYVMVVDFSGTSNQLLVEVVDVTPKDGDFEFQVMQMDTKLFEGTC